MSKYLFTKIKSLILHLVICVIDRKMDTIALVSEFKDIFLFQFSYCKNLEKNLCIFLWKQEKNMSRSPIMILIYSQLSLKAMLVHCPQQKNKKSEILDFMLEMSMIFLREIKVILRGLDEIQMTHYDPWNIGDIVKKIYMIL